MATPNKPRSVEVRLVDIANELDVSVVTVSRSLRHDRSISPGTRARVHEVAGRLGYKGSAGKTRLAWGSETQAGTIGLLLRHESIEAAHRDNVLTQMLGGIMSITDHQGMQVKMHTWPGNVRLHFDEAPDALPPLLQEGGCQALIVHGYLEERNLTFLSRRMPVVSMGRHYRELAIDAAVADNTDGMHRMVTYLVHLGHRRLAWVGGHTTWSFTQARQAGFMQGCIQHGLEINPRFYFGSELWEKRQIRDTAALLAAVESGVTAFVCGHDYAACCLAAALEAAGKRVPSDVSVTGFDGSPMMPGLRQTTSMDPGFFEIGKAAARLALQRIAFPMDKTCVVALRGELLPGDTTAPFRGTG